MTKGFGLTMGKSIIHTKKSYPRFFGTFLFGFLFAFLYTNTAQAQAKSEPEDTTAEEMLCTDGPVKFGACIRYAAGKADLKDTLVEVLTEKKSAYIKQDGIVCRMTNKRGCVNGGAPPMTAEWHEDLTCKMVGFHAARFLNRLASPVLKFQGQLHSDNFSNIGSPVSWVKAGMYTRVVFMREVGATAYQLITAKTDGDTTGFLSGTVIAQVTDSNTPLVVAIADKAVPISAIYAKAKAEVPAVATSIAGISTLLVGTKDERTGKLPTWRSRSYKFGASADAARKSDFAGKQFVVYDRDSFFAVVGRSQVDTPYIDEKLLTPRTAGSMFGTEKTNRIVISFPEDIFD